MDLKYVENFASGKVVLLVYGAIGVDEKTGEGVSGSMFAQVLNYLQHDPEVHEIEVRVNSHGGTVLDALNIFNAIRSSSKPCNTVIDGIAASSGGLVAMAGHKRAINDFGRLMIHAPSLPDKARSELDENTVKMLDQFQDLIADLLTANSKHNKAQIMQMINAETWFNAEQALAAGFVDEVLDTGRKFEEIFNELDLRNADLSLVVNQLTNKKHIEKMEKIKDTLGLDKSVNEDVVNGAVAKIVNEKTQAEQALAAEKAAHDATKAKLSDAQNQAKAVNDASAISFVENAIKEGKFTADNKEALIAQAKNDLDAFKALTESIATPAKRITDVIDKNGDVKDALAGEIVDGKLDGKTLRELEKENPAKVSNLIEKEPEKYKQMFVAQYGSAPNF